METLGWDAQGEAVELAGGLGQDELEGLGGARRAGNHVDGGGAGAAQVLVRKSRITWSLCSYECGHDAADDAGFLEKNLDDRARQLVVQLALEMMLCLAGSYLSSLTPARG